MPPRKELREACGDLLAHDAGQEVADSVADLGAQHVVEAVRLPALEPRAPSRASFRRAVPLPDRHGAHAVLLCHRGLRQPVRPHFGEDRRAFLNGALLRHRDLHRSTYALVSILRAIARTSSSEGGPSRGRTSPNRSTIFCTPLWTDSFGNCVASSPARIASRVRPTAALR